MAFVRKMLKNKLETTFYYLLFLTNLKGPPSPLALISLPFTLIQPYILQISVAETV